MDNIPPYFKEYMEQKFRAVDEQFGDIKNKLDNALNNHDKEIDELRKDVQWLNQKVWMALGALVIISLVGGVFAAYFKELNKNQIHEALQSALSEYNVEVK